MFSQDFLDELSFLHGPRKLWMFPTGINECSREGASTAEATVSGVCFCTGENLSERTQTWMAEMGHKGCTVNQMR